MRHRAKAALRRWQVRKRTENLLRSVSDGSADAYDGYRALYLLWCSYNAAVPELRPLFRMPGVEPDGSLRVTDVFREQVRSLAKEILPLFSGSPREAS